MTGDNTACSCVHKMNAISIEYADLSSAALITIFRLADLLSIPPMEAAKIYLQSRAMRDGKQAA